MKPLPLIVLGVLAGCGGSTEKPQDSDGGSASQLKATALSVGDSSACAAVADGGVVCWGAVNDLLGNDSESTAPTTVPKPVAGLSEHVTSLAMGVGSACAVTDSGHVWCWGVNCYDSVMSTPFCLTGGDGGQFGEAAPSAAGMPVPITGLSDRATAVSVGGGFACSLLARGTVECWGAGNRGQTGDSDMSNLIPAPVSGLKNAVAVSAGSSSACAITAGGGVVCWGANDWGQLGNNSTADSAVAVQVTGLTAGVTSVSVGQVEACAVNAGGAVVCWGWIHGAESDSGPPTPFPVPVPVTGLTRGMAAVSLSTDGEDACSVTQGGAVRCWGDGLLGVLGNGSKVNSRVPIPVAKLSGVATVSVGRGFACALTRAGGVQCWDVILGAQFTSQGGAPSCTAASGLGPCSDTPLPVLLPVASSSVIL